ncbi:hypothetical protein AZE42_03333 [Rhizopogon vesiculosus]|uniref:Thioredoxin domain-containing protein n=1 Tax=Rhizopogon vesiculosus TaxID=180088 RepID=A0A1J8R0S3_9AGAM|nr:hypothetical protein AZE42_03333 [Rhizopogon vesiculosus]
MKSLAYAAGFLSLTALVDAQYFSAGWTPGQPVPSQSASPVHTSIPPSNPAKQHGPGKMSFLDSLVTVGPLAAISSLIGLNITGTPAVTWDERIPLITDENYAEMIVNETLTPEEEKERVWFLIITTTAGQPEGVSKFVDGVFDATYNYTLDKADLPHVRFGRVDYLNVTSITTKWVVWSAPYLVVLKDRGQELRFYKAGQIRLTDEILHQFLKEEGWKIKDPWRSIYGPGGEREYLLDYLAQVLSTIYGALVRVPKWLMYMMSGGLATFLINFLHKPSPPKSAPKAAVERASASAPPSQQPDSASSTSTKTPQKGSSNKRKGKK